VVSIPTPAGSVHGFPPCFGSVATPIAVCRACF